MELYTCDIKSKTINYLADKLQLRIGDWLYYRVNPRKVYKISVEVETSYNRTECCYLLYISVKLYNTSLGVQNVYVNIHLDECSIKDLDRIETLEKQMVFEAMAIIGRELKLDE